MKKTFAFLVLSALSANAFAVKLSDYSPYKFEALFTNPDCKTYRYSSPLRTEGGGTVSAKPDNVYCTGADESRSVSRETSPQYRLKEWVSASSTKEIYLAYLSFSSKNMSDALCKALERGVKVTMVIDHGEDPAVPVPSPAAEGLKKCAKSDNFSLTYRGSEGGLGFAHNKIMIINPKSSSEIKLVFSSGNMSSGTSTNHENWNFVTTSPESYFAQSHVCVIEAMRDAGDSKANFAKALNGCRSQIAAEPESDIKVFFSPVDGAKALSQFKYAGSKANLIEGMSHRLSGQIASAIQGFMKAGTPVKFILDDDIYWANKRNEDIGRNTAVEAHNIYNQLIKRGMETKFLQTNQQIFQLQHNKFMIFSFERGGAVFNGAGNFTSAAFTKNFENFYYITIPEVVDAYKAQYRKYYDEMASSEDEMTVDYVLP